MVTAMTRRSYVQYNTLEETDIEMNAQAPAIRVPDTLEKPRHYGFAQVPRVITRGTYKTLSLIEKGLYTCLKDICGDAGECFYTLRRLAEEICTSISTLSRYIPKLIARGLIAATKKPGTKNKHEIYHIAIVDIWQENDATYKPKIVSDSNKVEDETRESVSDRNNPSNIDADSNNNSEIVSDSNKDCFYLNDRVIPIGEEDSVIPTESISEHIPSTNVDDALPPYSDGLKPKSPLSGWLEEITLLDDAFLAEIEKMLDREPPAELSTPVIPNVDTPSHIAVPIPKGTQAVSKDAMATAKPAPQAKSTRKKAATKQDAMAIDITAEGMQVYRDWCSLFKVTVPLNKAIAKAANELVEPLAVWSVVKGCSHKEILKLIKNWLYENDKNGYYSRGVKLYDIAREFEGWQSKQEQPQSMNGSGKKAKPAKEEELVFWQGRYMTEDEANTMGFEGGFGAYVSQQQF